MALTGEPANVGLQHAQAGSDATRVWTELSRNYRHRNTVRTTMTITRVLFRSRRIPKHLCLLR
jgi:predicted RNA-binding protein with PUA-like domain